MSNFNFIQKITEPHENCPFTRAAIPSSLVQVMNLQCPDLLEEYEGTGGGIIEDGVTQMITP